MSIGMILILRDIFAVLVGPAFGAVPEELQLIPGNRAAGDAFRILHGLRRENGCLQILHAAAAGADKVGVRGGMTVIALQTVDHADGLNDALFLEHGNVAIDGAQAQIRKLGLQLLIDPFGAGVALGLSDAVENGVTFPAVFSDSFHVSLHFNNNYYNHNVS